MNEYSSNFISLLVSGIYSFTNYNAIQDKGALIKTHEHLWNLIWK